MLSEDPPANPYAVNVSAVPTGPLVRLTVSCGVTVKIACAVAPPVSALWNVWAPVGDDGRVYVQEKLPRGRSW